MINLILSELVCISPYLFILSPAIVKNVNLTTLSRDVLRGNIQVIRVDYFTGWRVVVSSGEVLVATPSLLLLDLVSHVKGVVLVLVCLGEEWSICCQVLIVFFIQSQLNVATSNLAALVAFLKV